MASAGNKVYKGKRVDNNDPLRMPEDGTLYRKVWDELFSKPGQAIDLSSFLAEGKKTYSSFSMSGLVNKLSDHYFVEITRVPEKGRSHYKLVADLRGIDPIIFG